MQLTTRFESTLSQQAQEEYGEVPYASQAERSFNLMNEWSFGKLIFSDTRQVLDISRYEVPNGSNEIEILMQFWSKRLGSCLS